MRRAGTLLVVLAAAGCGSGAPVEVPATPAERAVLAYVWAGNPGVTRLDAATLRPAGPQLRLDEPPMAWARSPGGDSLALGSGAQGRVTVVDIEVMRRLSTADLGARGFVVALAWPALSRVLAALGGPGAAVVVLDPESGRAVARHALGGQIGSWARTPDGLAALLSPPDEIGPATLAIATEAGVRTIRLPVEAGIDPPAVREPGLAVSPDGRRALVLPGGDRVLEVDVATLAVTERTLSETVSFLGRLRAWLDPIARAKGPLEGPVRRAAWIDAHHVAVWGWDSVPVGERAARSDPAGVRLVDTRDWRVRTLSAHATTAVVADGAILAAGGATGPAGLQGIGLRAFAPSGDSLFELFGDRYVAELQVGGPYAYVLEQSEAETRVEIVDLRRGEVVRTVRRPSYISILS